MAKALVITEKPSVARDIAEALGGFSEHDGYQESDAFVVTFAVGHLYELLAPEELDPVYKRWTLDTLPIIPEKFRYKAKSGHAERIRVIKKLLARKDVDAVVNACDAGREGELIFREVVQELHSEKPIRRLWLQSMTHSAIRGGFDALQPGERYEGLASAAECRSFADWLIGMNATRALTKRLKSRKERTAWSAGRVQTPTLALLVDREFEVLAHVPRPFWRVKATFEHEGRVYEALWFDRSFDAASAGDEEKEDRIFDEARTRAIVEAVAGRPGVAEESRKPSRESAPPLFDLTSLQREANGRFGWSARRTLGAAQRCYDAHKVLTYPRTDSRCLPSDYRATVDDVIEAFAGGSEYAEAATRLRADGLQNTQKVFDDRGISDHFAIIPTGVIPTALTGDDRRLFDLVVRRFLGAFYPPAVWERVERTTEVAGEHFRTRARSLQEPGWRFVLGSSGEEEEETSLPPLVAGRSEASGVRVAPGSVEEQADETRPPARITEARLLSLMENAGQQIEDEDLAAVLHEKGIGTPATRADVFENLIAKGYVVRLGKLLRPTVKGIRLIDILRRIHIDRLASAQLTGELESHLLDVERGRRSGADFMSEIEDYARQIVERAKTFEYEDLYSDVPPLGPCPRCKRPVLEYAWFYRCAPEPDVTPEDDCPVRLWKEVSGRYLDRATARRLLADGSTGVLEGFAARNGRMYKGRLEVDREEWKIRVRSEGWTEGDVASELPDYDVDPAPLGRCPFDEDCSVVESPTHFICERKLKEAELGKDEDRPKSCGFTLPRTVCKREITRDEALVYLAGRRTELLTDFTSRFGRPFSATLVLRDNGRHGFEFPPRAAGARRGGKKAAGSGTKKTARTRKKAGDTAARPASPRRKKKTGAASTRKAATRKRAAARKPASRRPRSTDTED